MWDLPEVSTPATNSRIENLLATASPSIRKQSSSRHVPSIDSNLQRSILLLNDTMTPGTRNVSSLKTGRTPKMASFNQSLNNTGFNSSGIDALRNMSRDQQGLDGDATKDITTYSATLFAEEDPGIEATSGLFNDFLNARVELPSGNQVFELVQRYEECCLERYQLLGNLLLQAPPYSKKFSRTTAMKNILQQERDTWRLLRTLYQDRVHTEASDGSDIAMTDAIEPRTSDQTIIENFYSKDSVTRQCQLVIDWLEQNAAEMLELDVQLEHFSDTNVPWENTLHALKTQSGRKSDRSIVTEMDPDAPRRQKCLLKDYDIEDEARMYKLVFSNIRGGDLARAQDLSMKCGQPWLAAALEGWRLFHDPNYSSDSNNTVTDVLGNAQRVTWKSVCWNMAQDDLLSIQERAIYAVYSGNLKLLLQVCESWEDYLWGYLRVMVDNRVEKELSDNSQTDEEMNDLPDAYWAKQLTVKQIFEEIEASIEASPSFYHIVQKYIILDDIDELLEQMFEIIRRKNSNPADHYLRFMAHLILFLHNIGINCKRELCDSILEAYVEDLIEQKRTNLVSYYVAALPIPQQVFWYAKFLEGIKDKEERQLCLRLAESVNLDVAKITKTVVENIRNKESEDVADVVQTKTTPEDDVKIEAIDWLVFDESQRIEAMKQANALMRKFIPCKKIEAAKKVFTKIPLNSIDVIIKHYTMQTGQTELQPEDDNTTREYICFQAYLQAHDSFNDWFEHFYHSKPAEPKLHSGATFSEQITFEHQLKQYQSDLNRWNHTLSLQTENVKMAMYNVLLFVDGGWMVDQNFKDAPVDEGRSHQLDVLRQICIPQITFLLHSVLHSTKQLKESIQLANIVSSEQNQLYKVFSKENMKLFLSKVKESALELLDDNMDSLGYSLD